MRTKAKILLLFLGDIIALYASLFLTLAIRQGLRLSDAPVDANLIPFSIIFIFWLLIFFIAGLYDLRRLRNNLDFVKALWLTILTSAIVSILIFYIIPFFGITPKTNLFIFVIVFTLIETVWRRAFNRTASLGEAPNRVLLIGSGAAIGEIEKTIRENAQLGYAVQAHMDESAAQKTPEAMETIIAEKNINCVIVPRQLKREGHLPAALYRLFSKGISVLDLPNFYEIVMRKVPLTDLEETWFLENIEGAAQVYDPLKRAWEFFVALVAVIILSPFEILIALLVALTSRGPVIYKQARVGKNGRTFMLYKFRSMRALSADGSAETKGAEWSQQGDNRITPLGKFLRSSHLDELPQLWNVLLGELSLVGPRPERPEIVSKLETQIPYYETRLLIKPGITGWAQLNHRADLALEDVKQKLQYDIYYLKNRSFILDLAIIAKTLKSFFVNPK